MGGVLFRAHPPLDPSVSFRLALSACLVVELSSTGTFASGALTTSRRGHHTTGMKTSTPSNAQLLQTSDLQLLLLFVGVMGPSEPSQTSPTGHRGLARWFDLHGGS